MILKPDVNCYLTQAQSVTVDEREFKTLVYIQNGEDAANWKQVTEVEKNKILSSGTTLGVDELDAEYLSQLETVIEEVPIVINSKGLTANESLSHKAWYPYLGSVGAEFGKEVDDGFRFRYTSEDEDNEEEEGEDTLWEVIQAHTLSEGWLPGSSTAALYKIVSITHAGTIDDPIPYEQGMAIEEGLYYTQYDKLYVGILTTQTGYPNDLAELFTLVQEVTTTQDEGGEEEEENVIVATNLGNTSTEAEEKEDSDDESSDSLL